MRVALLGSRAAQLRHGVDEARDRRCGRAATSAPSISGGRIERRHLHQRRVERDRSRARRARRRASARMLEGRDAEQDRQAAAPRRRARSGRSCASSGSVEPKCALTLRARFALPGRQAQHPAVVEQLPLRLQRVEARLPRRARSGRARSRRQPGEHALSDRHHDQRVAPPPARRRASRRCRS